jgi:hypothetical protein
MRPEVREQWVAALRSGKYKQMPGALARVTPEGSRYCCLGVLCDIAVQEGVLAAPNGANNLGYVYYGGMADVLPEKVVAWAELPEANPELAMIEEGGEEMILAAAEWNDTFKKTFEEIADAIEYTYADRPAPTPDTSQLDAVPA